jgi:outer membrane protein assembly factor BamB
MEGLTAADPQAVGEFRLRARLGATGEFSAIRATTGVVAWQQQTGMPAAFKPNWAVDEGTVILPSTTQPLTVYDAVTGSKGTTTFGSPGQFAGGAIGAANGVLYAVQESGALFAVRIATGTILWQRYVSSNGSGFFTGIVISDGAIYITDDSGMLYSVNAALCFHRPGTACTPREDRQRGMVLHPAKLGRARLHPGGCQRPGLRRQHERQPVRHPRVIVSAATPAYN